MTAQQPHRNSQRKADFTPRRVDERTRAVQDMADGPFLVGMSTSHGHTPAADEAVAQPLGIRIPAPMS